MLTGACPILPSRDLDTSAAFYADLGFRLEAARDDYLILSCHGVVLHFFRADPAHDPEASVHGVWIDCPDPDGAFAIWAEVGLPRAGIPRLVPPEDKPWGLREMALVDPDGTILRIGRTLKD